MIFDDRTYMPIYGYICKCGNSFDRLLSGKNISKYSKSHPCDQCNQIADRVLSTGISGSDGVAEPWEYDYTHKANPKFVRDSKGNRQKFNPNTMMKGRRGGG
jgi:hypothetical protein